MWLLLLLSMMLKNVTLKIYIQTAITEEGIYCVWLDRQFGEAYVNVAMRRFNNRM